MSGLRHNEQSDEQNDEQDELQKYLAEKHQQDQEKALAVEPLSAYEACVLKESDRVRELVAEARKGLKDDLEE